MKLYAGLALLFTATLDHESQMHQLDWLVGCWVSSDQSAQEVWVLESDNSLRGFGVAIGDSRIVSYELLHIGPDASDQLIYTAHPSGQGAASFSASELGEGSALFTNSEHDYPQEIRYVREGNRLTATISLLGGANPNVFEKNACSPEQ